jgi:biopolymer transport protein ExbD
MAIMGKYEVSEYLKQKPTVQLAPLVDIAFWALIFFMIIAVFSQLETEVSINVPKSTMSTETAPNAGKLVINIYRDGRFMVNQQELTAGALQEMLKKVSKLFPNQQIIIRADEQVYHKYVIQAMDACIGAGVRDISFSTIKEDKP